MVNQFTIKEARIKNGKKTISSTNCVVKIGQLHAKEWNLTTFLHQKKELLCIVDGNAN